MPKDNESWVIMQNPGMGGLTVTIQKIIQASLLKEDYLTHMLVSTLKEGTMKISHGNEVVYVICVSTKIEETKMAIFGTCLFSIGSMINLRNTR